MNVRLVAASLGLGLLVASTAHAQTVSADILIGTGPVAGRVSIGERYPSYRDHYSYRAPARRVVVQRYRPRVIVVERFHRGRDYARYHDRGRYHQVRAYYDDRGHYYDGYCDGLREVTVYERDGHYYRDDDRYDDRDHHSYRTSSYGY